MLLSSGLGLQGTEDVLQNVGNLNYPVTLYHVPGNWNLCDAVDCY